MGKLYEIQGFTGKDRLNMIIVAIYCCVFGVLIYGVAWLFDSKSLNELQSILLFIIQDSEIIMEDYSSFSSCMTTIYEILIFILEIIIVTLFASAIFGNLALLYIAPAGGILFSLWYVIIAIGKIFSGFGFGFGLLSIFFLIITIILFFAGIEFISNLLEKPKKQ